VLRPLLKRKVRQYQVGREIYFDPRRLNGCFLNPIKVVGTFK
jgi:hypothetical protein